MNKLLLTSNNAKHEFDLLHYFKNGKTNVRRATLKDIEQACALTKDNLPNSTADANIVKKVITHNTDNIFVFTHNESIVGVYAMLMLTPLGLERLLLGEFNGENPNFLCLAKTEEVPAGIYVWVYVAPGLAANGIRHISHFLQQPKYRNVNFFARPVTEAGARITKNLGYEHLENVPGGLYRYVRLTNREPELQHPA